MRRAAQPKGACYAGFVKKVIREILQLAWKVVRTYLWRWLRPRLFRYAFLALLVIGAVFVLGFFLVSSC